MNANKDRINTNKDVEEDTPLHYYTKSSFVVIRSDSCCFVTSFFQPIDKSFIRGHSCLFVFIRGKKIFGYGL